MDKFNLTNCRLCGISAFYGKLLDLKADKKTFLECAEIIDYLNADYLDISESNKLPKTTCEKCYETFRSVYKFFEIVEQSQFLMSSIYNNLTVKSEPKDNSDTGSEDSYSDREVANDPTMLHCRFCAKQNPLKDLIDITENENRQQEYLKILQFFKIHYVNLTQANLPKTSCRICSKTIQDAYKFFQNVKNVQNTLNGLYNKSDNVKTEPIEKINLKIESDSNHYNAVSINREIESWSDYTWTCCHCSVVFENIDDLRSHSKEKHSMCYAYSCSDCDERFKNFNDFVEHVLFHRDGLRLHCQYCNSKFNTKQECSDHIQTHYVGKQSICEQCGELFPYPNILQWHQKLYGGSVTLEERSEMSWVDYKWFCQECNRQTTDVDSLRAHTQSVHNKCFAMKCMDCSAVMKNYKVFVSHVREHRPNLRDLCQYCNKYFQDIDKLNLHVTSHITSQQRPCNTCGQTFTNNTQLADHKRQFVSNKNLRKRQKKRAKIPTTEDLTCSICFLIFRTLDCLKRHENTHDGTDFVCSTCGRSFQSKNAFKEHTVSHGEKTHLCQVCNKAFHSKSRLKHHIITHSKLRPFVCDECGNSFRTKNRLTSHLKSHSNIKPFKCSYCEKEFKFKENLKRHEHQHTGKRPYACEHCEKTFTNWTNCNKHMMRKHGVTLARTKITSQGKVAINRRTGEVDKLATDEHKDWLQEMLKPQRKRKKTV